MSDDPNAKLLEIKQLAGEKEILESFRWIPNMDRVREMSRKGPGKFYKVVAIHPMITDPKNEGHGPRRWTDEELKMATRTGIGKPLNINHVIPITGGNNLAIDAEYESNRAEALFYIEDTAVQQGIADKKIRTVSIQATAREAPIKCSDGTCAVEPKGAVIYAWALVTNEDFMYNGQLIPADKPGDPDSSIELLETNRAGTVTDAQTAIDWLKKAIKLHQAHMDGTEPTSDTSQMKMMDQMKKALAALTGDLNENERGHIPHTSFSQNSGQSVTEMADTVDSIIGAINGLQNLTAETKTKLAELAKSGFGTAGAAGSSQAGTSLAEVATLRTEVEGLKGQINELKGSFGSVQGDIKKLNETLDQKLETSFNRVLNEKLKDIKPQGGQGGGAPPARGGVQTLETLGEDQLANLALAKLRDIPMSEVVDFATRGAS